MLFRIAREEGRGLREAAGAVPRRAALVCVTLVWWVCVPADVEAIDKLSPPLKQVEQRLAEESTSAAAEPNSLAFRRAIGEVPARQVLPRKPGEKYVLTLDECLRLAFANNNGVKQTRDQIIAVGGSKIIANSRFLPAVELINQYEHVNDFESGLGNEDSYIFAAKITQRLLEYGKDNPIDVTLRAQQRDALFIYENQVAFVFSQVRRAFFFIKLKERQIATRQELLEQFEKQYQVKQQRLEAGNLSVKIEVLTARLNVLNEQTRINQLERQEFNRTMELLRLVGLPVGADQIELVGNQDEFGLKRFDMEQMIRLALAQSSDVALAEAIVAEDQRTLNQLRYEYIPDLRFIGAYRGEDGGVGAAISNENYTWGLDVAGVPRVPSSESKSGQRLGRFGDEVALGGPDPGWFTGLQLRIPVFEGYARKGRQIEARAFLNAVKAALADQKDRVELGVRQSYRVLAEQKFQVELAQEQVGIERERFQIEEELRNVGRITDDQLETFRRTFFEVQDDLFSKQEALIERQEDLRLAIRYFK